MCKCFCESIKRNLQFSKTVCFDVSPCSNESVESEGVDICSGFLVPPSEGSSVGGRFFLLQEEGGDLDLKCDRLVFVMRGE